MRTFKKVLNGKGLLAASVALLSGHALAETAGRVSFVSGDASVTGSDGSSRALQRGAAINSGDRINTRAGRVQVRFTDGSFVSLQPNTVFGIDEYLYANRKPEETSLFFSLVQGGMRTITGAIGKVNKKSYQVRTPVATIGIRGTEYLARVDERGLVVSVGRGFVNVANERGDVTGGARQNIRVNDQDTAPKLSDEQAELQARGANDREDDEDEEEQRTVAIADVQNDRGDYLFLSTSQQAVADSVAFAGPQGSNVDGGFGDQGLTFSFDGAQLMTTAVDSIGNTRMDRQDALATDAGQVGALKWGRWYTSGSSPITLDGSPVEIGSTDSLHYIVGPMTPHDAISSAYGQNTTATYTYQGGTPATGNDGTLGSVTAGSTLTITFFSIPTLTMDIGIDMASGNDYQIGGSAQLSLDSSASKFIASTGTSCSYNFGSSSCSASISGFFAGEQAQQIGLGYNINDGSRVVTGAAAFGSGGITPITIQGGVTLPPQGPAP